MSVKKREKKGIQRRVKVRDKEKETLGVEVWEKEPDRGKEWVAGVGGAG